MNNNNEDLISIIILVYNSEKYIKKCFNSIINQTYKNIEIVIVNDGSTDNSETIIKEFILNNNINIKFINRKENKGTMYSRCEGYNNTNGKYIMFVDSDDWIDSTMIEKMHSYIVEYQTDLVKCNYKMHIGKRKIIYNEEIVDKPIIYKKEYFEPLLYDILYNTTYCNCVWMQLIKKDILIGIEKIDKNLQYGEDLQINLQILKNANSVLFIPDYLYNYYINDESITNIIEFNSMKKKLIDSLETYNMLYRYVDIFNINDKEKYRKKSLIKLADYFTMISLKLFANIKSNNNIRQNIIELRNKNIDIEYRKMIFNKLKNKNIICAYGFNLLMKNNLIYFSIYSKTIYKLASKIYKIINIF